MYSKGLKIGILGSGMVGQVLGKAFIAEGHSVILGTRNNNKAEVIKWKTENPKAQIGNFEQTAQFGDILVLATKGDAVLDVLKLAGIDNFKNKIIIDATNPIANEAPVNGVLKFFTTYTESLMEQIQKCIPQAKVVKAFSCVGNALMYKPKLAGGTPTMFICGNDADAKKTVKEILTIFGWETEDMGFVEAARAIEPLCMLWCIPGLSNKGWMHAFKLLR
jgi:predicted dinucleotide-binding enzyme